MELIAAFTLGLIGSLHCVGMCGPIALALPLKERSGWKLWRGMLLYNSGRVLTYSILGLLFGLLGTGIVLTGFQNGLSIAAGVFILLMLTLPAVMKNIFPLAKLMQRFRRLFADHRPSALFTIGMLNGLLPCGLVYVAIAGALAAGTPQGGALFMMSFGVATLPAMIAVSFAGKYIGATLRQRIQKFVPVMVGVLALLLIVRGLDLGIPYLSPKATVVRVNDTTKVCTHHCCGKAK